MKILLEALGIEGGTKGLIGTFIAIFSGNYQIGDLIVGIFYIVAIGTLLNVLRPLLKIFEK